MVYGGKAVRQWKIRKILPASKGYESRGERFLKKLQCFGGSE